MLFFGICFVLGEDEDGVEQGIVGLSVILKKIVLFQI